MNCKDCRTHLPDLLLDPASQAAAAARRHLEACPPCKLELEELQAAFGLLDEWHAPEPSPYFDQKLAVRIREEQAAPPAGWFERLRSRLLFNTGRELRPAMAGALALVLIVGAGTVADLTGLHSAPRRVQASATVNDLQILDKNEQALQTMDQLLDDSSSDDSPSASQPAS